MNNKTSTARKKEGRIPYNTRHITSTTKWTLLSVQVSIRNNWTYFSVKHFEHKIFIAFVGPATTHKPYVRTCPFSVIFQIHLSAHQCPYSSQYIITNLVPLSQCPYSSQHIITNLVPLSQCPYCLSVWSDYSSVYYHVVHAVIIDYQFIICEVDIFGWKNWIYLDQCPLVSCFQSVDGVVVVVVVVVLVNGFVPIGLFPSFFFWLWRTVLIFKILILKKSG